MAIQVDPVNAQQIDVVEVEERQRSIEGFEKVFGGVFDDDFGLDNQAIAGEERKNFAQLDFGGTVGTGGFDVSDPEINGTANCGFEIFLVGFGNLFFGEIAPGVLVPHSATGKDGHLQVGTSEAAVLHGSEWMERGRSG